MTFEGAQLRGAAKIAEKLQTLTFQKINRVITVIDSQPTFDGGVLISVLGRLQVSIRPIFLAIYQFILNIVPFIKPFLPRLDGFHSLRF